MKIANPSRGYMGLELLPALGTSAGSLRVIGRERHTDQA